MKVMVVTQKLVKPCKPTPPHLRRYKISLFDETNPVMNHPRILYFSSKNGFIDPEYVQLEESLAQILPNFYVLAGRYNKEKREVDCDDQGAEFSTAQADVDLSQIMVANVDPEQLNQLLPVDVSAADEPTHPILAVQINRFRCGGLAIGICASHRVIDNASFALFITAWAKAAASGGAVLIQPHFDAHSDSFPAENLPPLDSHAPQAPEKIVARRLVFDREAIRRLRERLRADWKPERPASRVVTVSAFLAQALLRADISRHGAPRHALVGQFIDARGRTVPPVPKHAFGTWIFCSFFELSAAEAAIYAAGSEFAALASKIYETAAQGVRDCARILGDGEFGRQLMVGNALGAVERGDGARWKVILATDVSKSGEYEADFGFGKPEWVSCGAAAVLENYVVLMNNRSNDGIEAWVYLPESDMRFLRLDKEIPMFSAARL